MTNINLPPTQKSIFAPSNQGKRQSISPTLPPKITISFQNEPPGSLCVNLPTFAAKPNENYFKTSQTAFSQKQPLVKRSNTGLGPKAAKNVAKRSSLFKMESSAESDNILKKFSSLKVNSRECQSPTEIPSFMKTPGYIKEYKYRSSIRETLRNGDEEDKNRALERLSVFSAFAYNITDTRPVSPQKRRVSKYRKKSVNSRRSSPLTKGNHRMSLFNTPPHNKKRNEDGTLVTDFSSYTSEDNDTFTTERSRTRKIFKKGILLTFKSKVKMFGAVRHIDYLYDFESFKPEEKKKHLLPILPDSRFNMIWGIVVIFLIALTAILTPIYISFVEDDDQFFYYLNLVTDIGFVIDILVNFMTAYYDPSNRLVTDFRKIFIRYLQMWFWIDFLSIFPLNEIVQWATENQSSLKSASKIMKLLRLPRIYKLLKIMRLAKMANNFSSNHTLSHIQKMLNLNKRVLSVLKIFINFGFLNHLVGCLWFFLVLILTINFLTLKARLDDFNPDTWVQRVDLADKDLGTQYIASVYWSFQTLTTVGYGDIAPQTGLERSVSAVWTVIGVLIYSFTVGKLSTLFFSFGFQTEELKNKITSFDTFAKQVSLPDFLNQKVRRFFEYKLNHQEKVYHWIDPNDNMKSLPSNIRTSLLLFSYYGKIKHIKFLQINPNFTASLIPHFTLLKVSRGDIIYREDDPSYEVYFILKGAVKFVNQSGKNIYSLATGTYFGEIEVFKKTLRQCFCQALDLTWLLICPKDVFVKTLTDFPDIKVQTERVAEQRKAKIDTRLQELKGLQDSPIVNDVKPTKKMIYKTTDYIHRLLNISKVPQRERRKSIKRTTSKKFTRKGSVSPTKIIKTEPLKPIAESDEKEAAENTDQGLKSPKDMNDKNEGKLFTIQDEGSKRSSLEQGEQDDGLSRLKLLMMKNKKGQTALDKVPMLALNIKRKLDESSEEHLIKKGASQIQSISEITTPAQLTPHPDPFLKKSMHTVSKFLGSSKRTIMKFFHQKSNKVAPISLIKKQEKDKEKMKKER